MSIIDDTRAYEAWLSSHIPLLAEDLAAKHRQMAKAPFAFLRATFYRWARRWPALCGELCDAPAVLAVGDLHTQNFGVWRDGEGRMAWGVNDVDEALPLPYAQDLVRLAASAWLAFREGDLRVEPEEACLAVLRGYRAGLERGGRSFVLAERHGWLRDAALKKCKNPAGYWQKLERLPALELAALPEVARELLLGAMPVPLSGLRLVHRVAGLGSLGRERWAALADWHGARVGREIKALAPSAWAWAAGSPDEPLHGAALLAGAVRAPDPTQRVTGTWVLRRLAPEYVKVAFGDVDGKDEEALLLEAMGWETANLHLATPAATPAILADLDRRPAAWLGEAARVMLESVLEDWDDWRAAA